MRERDGVGMGMGGWARVKETGKEETRERGTFPSLPIVTASAAAATAAAAAANAHSASAAAAEATTTTAAGEERRRGSVAMRERGDRQRAWEGVGEG